MLQQATEAAAPTLEPWAPLSDLHLRARLNGSPVAVLCLGRDPGAWAPQGTWDCDARVQAELDTWLEDRAPKCAWATAPGDEGFFVLLEADERSAQQVGERWIQAALRHSPFARRNGAGSGLSMGLAMELPGQEPNLELLLAVALEGLAVARVRGGSCVIHTHLYGLARRMLESAHRARSARARGRLGAEFGPAAPLPGRSIDAAGKLQLEVQDSSTLLAPDALQEALEAERRRLEEGHLEEVALLERRIQRLMRALEATEQEMMLLSEQVDRQGLPSAYALSGERAADRTAFMERRELLTRILEDNLQLHRRRLESEASETS